MEALVELDKLPLANLILDKNLDISKSFAEIRQQKGDQLYQFDTKVEVDLSPEVINQRIDTLCQKIMDLGEERAKKLHNFPYNPA